MSSTVDRGRRAETLAAAFLSLLGYTVRDRNIRFGPLELDLVIERGEVLAVAEVKYRRRVRLGGAAGAVTPVKQRRLETAAVRYALRHGLRHRRLRFDVVLIEAGEAPGTLTLRHVEGAFPASGRYRL